MTQYLRGQQAYAATTSIVAQTASSELQNLSYLNARLQQVAPFRGTAMLSQSFTQSGTARWTELPDALYASLVAAGYAPQPGDTSQNTAPTPALSLNSNLVNIWNPGVHRQINIFLGDSISASDIGGGTYPLMSTPAVDFFAQPILQMGVPYIYKLGGGDTQGPAFCYTCSSLTEPRSRIHYKFGQDSCRASNIPAGPWGPAFAYVQGSPWAEAIVNFLSSLVVFPGQQVNFTIWLGTNDFNYADLLGNPGLGSVPVGTPGAAFAKSPNYITNSLIPLITACKSIVPDSNVVWIGPIQRGASVSENAKFVEAIDYVQANKAALLVDEVIDTRTFLHFDPRVISNSNDPHWYQNDGTHMTPAGYIDRVNGIPARVLACLDRLLGY
jgi:lysophospholipase L1-like esterase